MGVGDRHAFFARDLHHIGRRDDELLAVRRQAVPGPGPRVVARLRLAPPDGLPGMIEKFPIGRARAIGGDGDDLDGQSGARRGIQRPAPGLRPPEIGQIDGGAIGVAGEGAVHLRRLGGQGAQIGDLGRQAVRRGLEEDIGDGGEVGEDHRIVGQDLVPLDQPVGEFLHLEGGVGDGCAAPAGVVEGDDRSRDRDEQRHHRHAEVDAQRLRPGRARVGRRAGLRGGWRGGSRHGLIAHLSIQ